MSEMNCNFCGKITKLVYWNELNTKIPIYRCTNYKCNANWGKCLKCDQMKEPFRIVEGYKSHICYKCVNELEPISKRLHMYVV